MKLSSPAFKDGGEIPAKYTADGQDISPPLQIADIPANAKTLAIICDDPDAPIGTWVHWVIYNIPANIDVIPVNCPTDEILANGARQGTSDFGRIGYGGPAPPSGTHRYYFTIYALNTKLDLPAGIVQQQLENAMKGHILAQSTLMGKYSHKLK